MNAREFVIELADQLTAQGRDVKVTTDEVDGAEMIRIWSSGRNINEYPIGASAFKNRYTGRWNFLGISAYPWMQGEIREKTRSKARIVATVYGTSYPRVEAAAS